MSPHGCLIAQWPQQKHISPSIETNSFNHESTQNWERIETPTLHTNMVKNKIDVTINWAALPLYTCFHTYNSSHIKRTRKNQGSLPFYDYINTKSITDIRSHHYHRYSVITNYRMQNPRHHRHPEWLNYLIMFAIEDKFRLRRTRKLLKHNKFI